MNQVIKDIVNINTFHKTRTHRFDFGWESFYKNHFMAPWKRFHFNSKGKTDFKKPFGTEELEIWATESLCWWLFRFWSNAFVSMTYFWNFLNSFVLCLICDAKSEKVDKLSYFCGLVSLLRINAANCKIVIAASDRKITRCGKVAY